MNSLMMEEAEESDEQQIINSRYKKPPLAKKTSKQNKRSSLEPEIILDEKDNDFVDLVDHVTPGEQVRGNNGFMNFNI